MADPIRGIVVSVGFDDVLAITLPKNIRFMDECVVVTSPDDKRTQEVVAAIPKCRCHVTDAFYRYGARFNKGLALSGPGEGFDVLGPHGWIWIHDADILLPDKFQWPEKLFATRLYGCRRRFIANLKQYHEGLNWSQLPLVPDADRISGYFQLFHANDPHITEKPWYDVTFTHAGGGDGYFDERWPRWSTTLLPYEVLHLGPWCSSWFGRTYARLDGEPLPDAAEAKEQIDQYQANKNWNGTERPFCDFNERVEVPGFKPSNFAPRPYRGPRRKPKGETK